jgi:hypothetical protein
MNILYLKLSPHIYDPKDNHKGIVHGLSIDDEPSEAARQRAEARAATTAPPRVHHAVTLSSLATGVEDFKVQTPTGMVEIVVLTISGAQSLQNPAYTFTLEISLTPNSEFTIRSTLECATRNVWLVLLTPVLAQVGKFYSPDFRCMADVKDGLRCRLSKTVDGWCPFHKELHFYLHKGELRERKPLHELTKAHGYTWKKLHENLHDYNVFQESLALRTIITEVLFHGDEDDNHHTFVVTTKNNRANIAAYLKDKQKHDGSGRVTVMSQIDRFLPLARARENNPQSPDVRERQLTVRLRDVRTIQRFHGVGVTPSIFDLFCDDSWATHDSVMYRRFQERVREIGDLPVWITYEEELSKKPQDQLTDEERQYLKDREQREMERLGFYYTPEQEALLDEFRALQNLGYQNLTWKQKRRWKEVSKELVNQGFYSELEPPESSWRSRFRRGWASVAAGIGASRRAAKEDEQAVDDDQAMDMEDDQAVDDDQVMDDDEAVDDDQVMEDVQAVDDQALEDGGWAAWEKARHEVLAENANSAYIDLVEPDLGDIYSGDA